MGRPGGERKEEFSGLEKQKTQLDPIFFFSGFIAFFFLLFCFAIKHEKMHI